MFLQLIDKTAWIPDCSEKEVEDLCSVIHGVFEISQVTHALDAKITITLLKALSRYRYLLLTMDVHNLECDCSQFCKVQSHK